MSNPNLITSTATAIAAQLGETHAGARATIWRCVRVLGPERAQAFVAQALDVEANGGMLIPDGSRTCLTPMLNCHARGVLAQERT